MVDPVTSPRAVSICKRTIMTTRSKKIESDLTAFANPCIQDKRFEETFGSNNT